MGIAAGVALAAALPALPYACGLATTALLAGDVVRPSLDGHRGSIMVGPVVADPVLLAEFAASGERRAWWLARLERCQQLLRAG